VDVTSFCWGYLLGIVTVFFFIGCVLFLFLHEDDPRGYPVAAVSSREPNEGME
jgi:hypothetical protein